MKKVKGLRNTNWQLQNGHEEAEYSFENIVNNIVITVYGTIGSRTYWGDPFISYRND